MWVRLLLLYIWQSWGVLGTSVPDKDCKLWAVSEQLLRLDEAREGLLVGSADFVQAAQGLCLSVHGKPADQVHLDQGKSRHKNVDLSALAWSVWRLPSAANSAPVDVHLNRVPIKRMMPWCLIICKLQTNLCRVWDCAWKLICSPVRYALWKVLRGSASFVSTQIKGLQSKIRLLMSLTLYIMARDYSLSFDLFLKWLQVINNSLIHFECWPHRADVPGRGRGRCILREWVNEQVSIKAWQVNMKRTGGKIL